MVSDADIVRRLTSVLRNADLSTTTTAAIRKQLEKDLGVDLTDRKVFIREQVDLYFQEQQLADDDEEHIQEEDEEERSEEGCDQSEAEAQEEEEKVPKSKRKSKKPVPEPDSKRFRAKIDRAIKASLPKEKKKRSGGGGGLNKACSLSPELQAIIGQSQLPRTQVVRLLWVYIREKNLQDPDNKRRILCNDELRGLFGVDSTDIFKMNKLLSKHIWPLDKPVDGEPKPKKLKAEKIVNEEPRIDWPKTEVKEAGLRKTEKKEELEWSKPEKKDVVVRAKNDKKESERQKIERKDSGREKSSGPVPLSDALAEFLGTQEAEMEHHEVMKFIWDYIVNNKLQDPLDKSTIICDEKLQDLFGCDKVVGFNLRRMLASHLKG